MDAQSRIPKLNGPLEFQDGQAWLMKTDILREMMYFSYEQGSFANLYPLAASEVKEVLAMNRNGEKPESLKSETEPSMPEFISAVGDDSITRFDDTRKKRRGSSQNQRKNRNNQNRNTAKGGNRRNGRREGQNTGGEDA